MSLSRKFNLKFLHECRYLLDMRRIMQSLNDVTITENASVCESMNSQHSAKSFEVKFLKPAKKISTDKRSKRNVLPEGMFQRV